MPLGGHHGRFLRVDLGSGASTAMPLADDVLRRFGVEVTYYAPRIGAGIAGIGKIVDMQEFSQPPLFLWRVLLVPREPAP